MAEDGTLSTALNDFFLPFRGDRLRDAVCIPSPPLAVAGAGTARLPVEAFGASRTLAFEAARQARWQQLVRTAREQKDEIVRRQLHGRPFGLLVFNGRRRSRNLGILLPIGGHIDAQVELILCGHSTISGVTCYFMLIRPVAAPAAAVVMRNLRKSTPFPDMEMQSGRYPPSRRPCHRSRRTAGSHTLHNCYGRAHQS